MSFSPLWVWLWVKRLGGWNHDAAAHHAWPFLLTPRWCNDLDGGHCFPPNSLASQVRSAQVKPEFILSRQTMSNRHRNSPYTGVWPPRPWLSLAPSFTPPPSLEHPACPAPHLTWCRADDYWHYNRMPLGTSKWQAPFMYSKSVYMSWT